MKNVDLISFGHQKNSSLTKFILGFQNKFLLGMQRQLLTSIEIPFEFKHQLLLIGVPIEKEKNQYEK